MKRSETRPFLLHSSSLILLYARDPRRGELIVACSAAAMARGVRVGMPLAEAAALAHRGGECRALPHDPAADVAELARLAEHCERFSPLVGWRTVEGSGFGVQGSGEQGTGGRGQGTAGADTLFLDVTGIGVLFGSEEALAREVVAELQRLGYEARVAIAVTLGAAWAGVQAPRGYPGFRVQEKAAEASADSVPSTQYLVLSTQHDVADPSIPDAQLPTTDSLPLFRIPHSALRTLPLYSLRLPPETLDLLSQLGVTQLDQLLALPRESLRARFGERLLLRLDQFFGTAQETIVAHRPPPRFAAEWVLEYPAERQDVIEQILRELLLRIAREMADRREGAVQLTCRLDCAPGQPLRLEVGLFRPSAEAEHLGDLLRMQLEQAALPGPVGRITLAADLTAPLENRQGELFAGGEHEADRELALLIDRCSSRLGADAVLRAELTADPLPERAFKVQSSRFKVKKRDRVRGSGRKRQAAQSAPDSVPGTRYSELRTTSALQRPLFLLNPPQPLATFSVAPDGPPVSFDLNGRRHTVLHHWGPERIETGWWRGRSIRRDYWRVETTSGQRYWLFRSLPDGKWHLHGEF